MHSSYLAPLTFTLLATPVLQSQTAGLAASWTRSDRAPHSCSSQGYAHCRRSNHKQYDGGGARDPADGPARRGISLGGVRVSGAGIGLSPQPERCSPVREDGHAGPREHHGLRPQPYERDSRRLREVSHLDDARGLVPPPHVHTYPVNQPYLPVIRDVRFDATSFVILRVCSCLARSPQNPCVVAVVNGLACLFAVSLRLYFYVCRKVRWGLYRPADNGRQDDVPHRTGGAGIVLQAQCETGRQTN